MHMKGTRQLGCKIEEGTLRIMQMQGTISLRLVFQALSWPHPGHGPDTEHLHRNHEWEQDLDS